MGCDIHLFVEYRHKENAMYDWVAFGGEFRLPRNYDVFALMAGVAGAATPVQKPRGLPPQVSWKTKMGYQWSVVDAIDDAVCSEKVVSRSYAKHWFDTTASEPVLSVTDGELVGATGPDFHSYSWLTRDELVTVRSRHSGAEPVLDAILSAMWSLEDNGYDTRVVFWFDN